MSLGRTTKEIGDIGERAAVHYLRLHGYTVRERNYRVGKYELDIIAANWRDIAFVEVKTRTCREEDIAVLPPPRHAVDTEKQAFTRRAAQSYLHEHPTSKRPRMDVIEIWLCPRKNGKKPRVKKLHHIKAAY